MSKTKKVFALVLAVLSVFVLSVTAFATPEHTFKMTIKEGDTHEYSVYQLLTGDYSVTTNKFSNAVWGSNANKTGEVSSADMTALDTLAKSSDPDAVKLNSLVEYVNFANPVGSVSFETPLEGLEEGYYLVKDKDQLPATDTYSLYIVRMANNDIEIVRKGATTIPTIEKTVSGAKGVDNAVNDEVVFTITGTIGNLTEFYSSYKYAVTDTLSTGLTYKENSQSVSMDSKDVTDAFAFSASNNVLSWNCDNVFVIDNIDASSVFTFTYKAILNANAVEGTAGNKNNATLTYSNNPNINDDGIPKTSDISTNATVYTYALIINEVDENNDPLPGVGLKLQKKDGDNWVDVKEIPAGTTTTFRWDGLDSGEYKLIQTETPDGYNTMKDKEFTITGTIDPDTGALTALTSTLEGSTTRLDPGEVEATIQNRPGISLPVTGAFGIVGLLGAAVAVTGAAIGMRIKGRKENEGENA